MIPVQYDTINVESLALIFNALNTRGFDVFEVCGSRYDEAVLWYDDFDGDHIAAIRWIEYEIPHPIMAMALNKSIDSE